MCAGRKVNPYSCDLERMAENSGAGRDTSAFKVSWALNVWQTGVKHSRAERSDPLCQPIGNELGAWPTSHDSVFYGPRRRMTTGVPERNLRQINKKRRKKTKRSVKERKKRGEISIRSTHTHTQKLLGKQEALGVVGGRLKGQRSGLLLL